MRKIGLILCSIIFAVGVVGLVYINTRKQDDSMAKEQDINKLIEANDLKLLTNNDEGGQFYGAYFRLAQKRHPKALEWFFQNIDNLEGPKRFHSIEFLGFYYDEKEARDWSKVTLKSSSNDELIALLKSFGKMVSSWNQEVLLDVKSKLKTKTEKTHYYASLFNSAFESSVKKEATNNLLELSKGDTLELSLTYLGRMLPNEPRVLNSMQKALFVSKDSHFLEMITMHLAKYRQHWMSAQGDKILSSGGDALKTAYIRTAFVTCPKNFYSHLKVLLEEDSKFAKDALRVMFSLPRKKSSEFVKDNKELFSSISTLDKAIESLGKGEIHSSCHY